MTVGPVLVTVEAPRTPKVSAVPRIELPKAGITAATAITNQINLCRIFSPVALSVSAAQNFEDSQDDKRQIGA
jgi:hypothetical protein